MKKRCKKLFRRFGMSRRQSARATEVVMNVAYDSAVNMVSTIGVDVIYAVADVAVTGVKTVTNKIVDTVSSKKATNIEEDLVEVIEESEA